MTRKVIPSVPVSVEYRLTPLGQTLTATVEALKTWAETRSKEVLAAQQRYDARALARSKR